MLRTPYTFTTNKSKHMSGNIPFPCNEKIWTFKFKHTLYVRREYFVNQHKTGNVHITLRHIHANNDAMEKK